MIKIVKQYGVSGVQSHSAPGKQALGRDAGQPALQVLRRAAGQQVCTLIKAAGLPGWPAGPVEPEFTLFGPYVTVYIQTHPY